MSKQHPGRTISVSFHKPSGQYRKYVGKQIGKHGSLQPKCWYLGNDQREAVGLALELTSEWAKLKRAGIGSWPVARDETAKDLEAEHHYPAHCSTTTAVAVSELTLDDAAKLYLSEQESRQRSNQVSSAHVRHCKYRIGRALDVLGRHRPLSSVDQHKLFTLVNHFVSRPELKTSPGQTKQPGRQMSIATAVGIILAVKDLFRWIDEHDSIPWIKPRCFRRIFSINRHKMVTDGEYACKPPLIRNVVPTFTIDELTHLYAEADRRVRAWMLLALNCGHTQKDLSDLTTAEIAFDATNPFIQRERVKTHVHGVWVLWPETLEAIEREMAPKNPLNRVFLSSQGKTLVGGENYGRDVVRMEWLKLREKAGMSRTLSFKYLRKTGADLIRRIDGVEVSEMYLAHVEPRTMSRPYTNRSWKQLDAALAKLRCQFENIWKISS